MLADTRGDPAAAPLPALLDLATDAGVRRLLPPPRLQSPTWRLRMVALLIGAAAIALPVAVVRFGPAHHTPYQLLVVIPGRVVPAAELPPVEPVEIRALDPDAARAFNATVPFSTAPNPAARPFRQAGAADDLARATDCLAAAAYYEAGDDPAGQRAVAQVVLNRVRHPAFPKTVCAVVFQGSERSTGCQFTFTCDGSLVRYTPTPESWSHARAIATRALAGTVDAAVGYATHYHTEWVVPYWLASLDKIVAVHTQLFYRWTGWWGTPPAFNRHADASEPAIAALARLSDAHRLGTVKVDAAPPTWTDDLLIDPAAPALSAGPILEALPVGLAPARWPDYAAQLCGARERCAVMAWRDKAHVPTTLPLDTAQIAGMAFSYVLDRTAGVGRPLWNCAETRRPDPHQCMKRQMLLTASPVTNQPAAPAPPVVPPTSPAAAPDLPGVRRKPGADVTQPNADAKAPRPGDRPRALTPPGTSPAPAP